ncbi:MAG: Ig-like domain-containing protein [Kiloniellales bacterium]
MTAQILATPPGSTTTLASGAAFPVEAGVIYQIALVDAEGNVGPILDPQSLVREADGNDLVVTLPDGTTIILEGMVQVLAEGAGGGLAGPDGTLVIATLEQAFAPAAGPQAALGGDDEGGSSQAFNQALITPNRLFGEAPEGPFPELGLAGFTLEEQDPNLVLSLSQEIEEPQGPPDDGPDPQRDIVITADDGRIVILGKALLANDSGSGLKIVSVQDYTGPGIITLRPDGNVEISQVADNPALNNSGLTQTFTYTVEDADGKTATTTVLVYVDEDCDLDGFVNAPAISLGNGESEIFIPLHPRDENEPSGVVTIVGGAGDDFIQIRDEQNYDLYGGDGFDTLVADVEYSSGFFDIDLPAIFSQANNSIERIDMSDEISGFGIVRIRPHGANTEVNWDFRDIELINVHEIVGRGGNDTIIGSAGDDVIYGDGTGQNGTSGAPGNDFIDGWLGNDVIYLGGGTGDGVRNVVRISAVDHGLNTIHNFDNNGAQYDQLTLDDLFDKLELDLGLGAGGLSTADRVSRVVLVDNGPGTDILIDQSLAGDGSDLVQIADVTNIQTSFWDVGGSGNENIFVGA